MVIPVSSKYTSEGLDAYERITEKKSLNELNSVAVMILQGVKAKGLEIRGEKAFKEKSTEIERVIDQVAVPEVFSERSKKGAQYALIPLGLKLMEIRKILFQNIVKLNTRMVLDL